MKAGQLRHHEGDENRDQGRAGDGEKRRINQRLLHAVAQIFCLHQMLDDAGQNLGQRAARFAGADHVHVERRKDAREIAQRLRETAAIDQRLVQRARHLLHARVLQPFLENAEAFVERHPRLQKMAELLRENEQLAVRDLEILGGRRGRGGGLAIDHLRARGHRFDPDRHAILLFDLPDGDGSVGDIEHAFDETALGIACAIGKLRHRMKRWR